MKKISLADFRPISGAVSDLLFYAVGGRTCSTRYLIQDAGRKKTMLIDSGDGKDELGFSPDSVFLTHGHFDHTLGVKPDWKEVWIHPAEDSSLPFINIPKNAKPLVGQHFDFGPFHFNIIHTPGHTPGSMCLFEEKSGFLFSGDTKFADGGCGRTDLGGPGAEEHMAESLQVLESVEWKMLCPGHGRLEERE